MNSGTQNHKPQSRPQNQVGRNIQRAFQIKDCQPKQNQQREEEINLVEMLRVEKSDEQNRHQIVKYRQRDQKNFERFWNFISKETDDAVSKSNVRRGWNGKAAQIFFVSKITKKISAGMITPPQAAIAGSIARAMLDNSPSITSSFSSNPTNKKTAPSDRH